MSAANLPTLYQHYTAGGIANGLSTNQPYLTLNNKNITIYSGAMHYFRVPPQYWRDRLRKMRAAGLNTVETYVPWNLHEPIDGYYDFGQGGTDFQEFLDIKKFLKTAQEEDLLVIVRPGPYICAEWDFGGFPSWLLRHRDIKLRTSDPIYMKYVTRYFNLLLSLLAVFQFTRGGPIVGFQIENEYSGTSNKQFATDKVYLQQLWDLMVQNGIIELLFTADSPLSDFSGTLPNVFITMNFQNGAARFFKRMKRYQPNKPLMVMEFWVGWFDHWSEYHHGYHTKDVQYVLTEIVEHDASVNFYMFHGGTSWGFMNGANVANSESDNSNYQPDVSSYDYDAPISENGECTDKYYMIKKVLAHYQKIKTFLPPIPKQIPSKRFTSIEVTGRMFLNDLLKEVPESYQSRDVMPMELLPMNNQSGQSYGFIVYRKTELNLPATSVLKIQGHICDSVVVLVNGFPVTRPLRRSSDLEKFGFWIMENSTIVLNTQDVMAATLDLLVENWGRVNYYKVNSQMDQLKGLFQGKVLLNEEPIEDWQIFPLEFRRKWTEGLTNWHSYDRWMWSPGPALYMAVFDLFTKDTDTFVDMSDWHRGIVIINGFVLGRYCRIGPQQTLYLPAPFLYTNRTNTIMVFEQYKPANKIRFSAKPIYDTI